MLRVGLIFLLRRSRCFGVSELPENWNSGEFLLPGFLQLPENMKLWIFLVEGIVNAAVSNCFLYKIVRC